jgi:DNA-directed RNA polymerase subunit E'/Rpb7
MSELFVPIKFNTTVHLKPNEIGANIDEIIHEKTKQNLENMCSKHGYIKQGSIKIIKRSIGKLVVSHFNGNITYDLQCIGEICNPAQGSIVKCRVKAKNTLGLLAEGFYNNIPILQIIVPKLSAGIQSEIDIETVNIGDEIKIEVCGKKFLLYDKFISIIGKVLKDKDEFINNVYETQDDDNDDEKVTEDNDALTIPDFNDLDDAKSEIMIEDEEDEEEDDNDEEDDEEDLSIDDDIQDEDIENEDDYEDFDE